MAQEWFNYDYDNFKQLINCYEDEYWLSREDIAEISGVVLRRVKVLMNRSRRMRVEEVDAFFSVFDHIEENGLKRRKRKKSKFERMTKDETRYRILCLLCRNKRQGLTVAEVSERMGGRSVRHYLDQMEREGLVWSDTIDPRRPLDFMPTERGTAERTRLINKFKGEK